MDFVGFRGLVVVCLTLAIAFSSTGVALAQESDDELILRVAMQDDIKTLNPLVAGDVWTWNVLRFIYDGAMAEDAETEVLIPYIAVGSANTSTELDTVGWADCDIGTFGFSPRDSWADPNGVGEAVIFYDFDGVEWHDGVQMTVRDVMFSFHVAAQTPDTSPYVNCLKDNGGRTSSNYTSTHWLHIYKVWESADEQRAALKFVLQEPFADFFKKSLSVTLLPYHIWGNVAGDQKYDQTMIWCDAGYDSDGDGAFDIQKANSFVNGECVGSGPFVFKSWDKGNTVKTTRYDDYFFTEDYKYENMGNAKAPLIDAIVYKIHKTAEAAVMALQNDDIDYIAWSIPPTFLIDIENDENVDTFQSPEPGFFYMAYNLREESFGYDEDKAFPYAPGDDRGKAFRKAVAHCIDKNFIVQRLLLNLGVAGDGPVSSISPWYNQSIPRYDFDPAEAIGILRNAGYRLSHPNEPPGEGNWWLNPDGSKISNEPDGEIKILTPEANYDPIRAQAGQMIAQQLTNIGIKAKSEAMDFGSIVARMENRKFEMYILGWSIGSDPTDFLHAFFHSENAARGQNYPGYQNESFDTIIEEARKTGDESARRRLIEDAQACIAYDLPYDVLYYRLNIEAYRKDRFTGWVVGSAGSIFNWRSIVNLRRPTEYKLNAQFVSPPSAMVSNDSATITISVRDQYKNAVNGAKVRVNATEGALNIAVGNTTASGKLSVRFTAPYVPRTPENIANGVNAILIIEGATYNDGVREYDEAGQRITLVTVYPEEVRFFSMRLSADPDIIDPDRTEDGTLGFTYVDVHVEDEKGDPASGIQVVVEVDPAIPTVSPESAVTDTDGKARFKVTASDLPEDNDEIMEYRIIAAAYDPDDGAVKNATTTMPVYVLDAKSMILDPHTNNLLYVGIVISTVLVVTIVGYALLRRRKASKSEV